MSPVQLQRTLQAALASHQSGRLDEADTLYRKARAAAPQAFDVLHLSGVLAYQKGRYNEAADLLARAHKTDRRHAFCEMRLGLALAALDRHAEAEPHYRNSLRNDPNIPESWNNLAVTLKALGQPKEAVACYRRAIELKPDYYDAYDRLGALLADVQGLAAGIPYFRKAVELKPDYAAGWCNLGLALIPEGKFSEALACFDRALAADPKLVQARVGRALAFQQSYRLEEAAAEYSAALAQEPSHHEARSARLLALNYLSPRSRADDFAEHIAFARQFPAPPAPFVASQTKIQNPKSQIRVAFLSPDLRSHSVAYFLEPLLRHLDRAQFEVVLYHDHFQVDAMSGRLRSHASLWRNFVGLPHAVVEKQIRADAPDLLIDLAGHTGYNRLPVFAKRVAPVQIGYLGYPNTTGLSAMDYRFVDAITDPGEEDQRFHSERLVRFAPTAWAYEPPATAPEVAPPPCTLGRAVTFGSFNNFAKVSAATVELWARILAAVPGSRLLLKGHGLHLADVSPAVARRLEQLAVDPARVELLGRTPNVASHLALYAQVDVALDTVPYNGTTTTCEALWMGVPVVTLLGDRHAARVSASLLTAAGHAEWIARTPEDYVSLASALAADPARLGRIRAELRDYLRRGPLLDHATQARHFGNALQDCWAGTARMGQS